MNRRNFLAAGLASVAMATSGQTAEPPRSTMGLLLYSYNHRVRAEKAQGFTEPLKFLEFAHARGAAGVQMPLGRRTEAEAKAVRDFGERHNLWVEGIVSPPKPQKADLERFQNELQTVRRCGGSVVRMVMLGGRRYEVFTKSAQFTEFAKNARELLKQAEPIAAKSGVALAVENHKDYRADELVDLLKAISSEWVGVCLDTGNSLSLLEEPGRTAAILAPFTRTIHLKDIALETAENGFHMAEVPIGQGIIDLKTIVQLVRQTNPQVRLNLEMITRDPLLIPCLTEGYWSTMTGVGGVELMRMLNLVRKHARKTPLPRLSQMPLAEQLSLEDRNVRQSLTQSL